MWLKRRVTQSAGPHPSCGAHSGINSCFRCSSSSARKPSNLPGLKLACKHSAMGITCSLVQICLPPGIMTETVAGINFKELRVSVA